MAHKKCFIFKNVILQSTAIIFLVICSGKSLSHEAHKEIQSEPRQMKIREGFSISPKNCNVAGEEGTCMFVWECLKSEGKHLGMCMDGFMFGSCCVHGNHEVTESSTKLSTSSTTEVSTEYVNELDKETISDDRNSVIGVLPDTQQNDLADETLDENYNDIVPLKFRPSAESTTETTVWESFPTRQTRPTKPWHKITQVSKFSTIPTTSTTKSTSTRPNLIHFIPPTRPTWKPVIITTSSTESKWSWQKNQPTPATSPSPSITKMSTTVKPSTSFTSDYYPSTSNNFLITKQPFRPTHGVTEVISLFPDISNIEIFTDNLQVQHVGHRPYPTVPHVSIEESSTASPSISGEFVSTPRPPFHVMTPPNLSTSTPSTPHPPPASPIQAPQAVACGVPVLNKQCPKGRIVNGTQSCYGQFPWQVSVRRTSFFGFSSTHRCGGVLINDNWVATAGHCVDDLSVAKIRLRIGEWDFSSTSEPQAHIDMKVVNKIVHPNYNFFTYEYDLALLKLEEKVTFQENIIPICLPGNDDNLVGETGIVAGWGRLSEGGQLPNILQYVSVPIVSNVKCKDMFLKANRHEVIPDIFMCAGYDNGGRDSCQGDSGGPLVVKGVNGRFFLGGIISWGIGCAEPNLPGVCTRISKFTDWIIEQIS